MDDVKPHPIPLAPMLESHEDRLQNVEAQVVNTRLEVQACNNGLTTLSGRVESLGTQVTAGFDSLIKKLDPMLADVADHKERFAKADAALATRKGRYKTVAVWSLAGLGTVAGAVLHKFGEAIWHLLK